MARNIAWVVAALLLVPASGRAAGPGEIGACEREQAPQQRGGAAKSDQGQDKDKPGQRPGRSKWWIDAKGRAELGITDQQSSAIELVWQKSLPVLREGRQKLDKLEESLSQLTDGTDEAAVIAQIAVVENLRADLNKSRLLMLYRMDKLLTPDQRAKLKAMRDRHEPPRSGSSPGKF